jgi:hypothetical protein
MPEQGQRLGSMVLPRQLAAARRRAQQRGATGLGRKILSIDGWCSPAPVATAMDAFGVAQAVAIAASLP